MGGGGGPDPGDAFYRMYFVRSQVDGPITEVRREGRERAYKWVIIARAGDTKMWSKIISA